MRTIKILIVDDSQIVHLLLEKVIAENPDISIIGNAYNGREGLELIKERNPDVVVMDIGMPLMDGLEAIQEIMYEHPVPVIVFSAASERIVDLSFKAIELGAVDLIEKPVANDLMSLRKNIEENLIRSIRTFADFKVMRRIKRLQGTGNNPVHKAVKSLSGSSVDKVSKRRLDADHFPVIGIAASTGGPQTLKALFENFSGKTLNAALVIVQHMAEGFMQGFGEWLAAYSPWPVIIPRQNDELKVNHVYIAPGEYHLTFNEEKRFNLLDTPPLQGIRPAADLMFSSLGEIFRERAIAIILTGMGNDGTIGLHKVKQYKGYTISQDEDSSLIFGMPKSAIEAGVVDKILGLAQIAGYVEDFCRERFG
jgi:two-component system chemotaxis response regulator CheB